MRKFWVHFLSGLGFAAGLALSGMTDPGKVIGFLDFTGAWDPALALVMVGAIAVYAPAYAYSRRAMPKPVVAGSFTSFPKPKIDRRLLGGSVIFGLGWGLAGYCPGPALASAAGGGLQAIVFSVAMVAGFWATRRFDERAQRRRTARTSEGWQPTGP